MDISTYLVKEESFEQTTKPHNLPLFATSSFNFESIDEGIDIFKGDKEGHVYGRYGNPTIETVANKLAKLEAFGLDLDAFGIMVSSGMAAISTLLIAELNPGDKLITQENLYGGTTELFKKIIQKFGIELIFVDLEDSEKLESIISEHNIKLLYCETPSNPTLSCLDLEYLSNLCDQNNIISVVDNTFCTSYIQQPFQYGFDYVIHSTTKFINGHGNNIAGVIIGKDKSNYSKVLDAMKLLGTNCNAFDAWLINNGIKTLGLRMDQHSKNALQLAEYLEADEHIEKVNYPFLDSSPYYQIAKKQMKHGGGMLSFELKGDISQAIKFMNNLSLISLAPTLGDIDSLILHPATMSHRNINKEVRERNGITDGLIRMSVGIENVDDLYKDIVQAINDSK